MTKLFIILLALFIINNDLISQNTEIWGSTYSGGSDNNGVIFKMDSNGDNFELEYSLKTIIGQSSTWTNLLEANNGLLYGVTELDGINNNGVLFEYNSQTDKYRLLHKFNNTDGKHPRSTLLQADNGFIYGTTSSGGSNDNGVIFTFNINTYEFAKIFDFNSSTNGSDPRYLIKSNNGYLYGSTRMGGSNSGGTLFKLDINTNILTTLYNFESSNDGNSPNITIIDDTLLYGTCYAGGINSKGTLFEFNILSNLFSKKIDFDGTNNGNGPRGELFEANNNKLYGMTYSGGNYGYGVFYEYNRINEEITKIIDFDGTNNGKNPYGSFIQTDDNFLYGMTYRGGTHDNGVIFKYNYTTDIYIKVFNFNDSLGANPSSSLVLTNSNKIYGLTVHGGIANKGVLFELNQENDSIINCFKFGDYMDGTVVTSLIQYGTGMIYGLSRGGIHGGSTIFEYNPFDSVYTKKIDFDNTNSTNPQGGLLQASNGKLYGTTYNGGLNNYGTVFEYDVNSNIITNTINLDSANTGESPFGSLIEADNGMLYGMTTLGGAHGGGTIFEYNTTNNTITTIFNFTSGLNPKGSLLQANNNILYGMTSAGGAHGKGVIFSYNIINNNYNNLFDFNGVDSGSRPTGSLIQVNDSLLYGMTYYGGINGKGAIFSYDIINNNYNNLFDFDGANSGANPNRNLLFAQNGNLYGTTFNGGVNNLGIVFEFNIENNDFTKKVDFETVNGRMPFGSLIEVSFITYSNITESSCNSYTVPSGDEVYLTSGEYIDTLTNVYNADSIITINLTINNSYSLFENNNICNGESYTFPDNVTIGNITEQIIHTSNLLTISNCDSIIETTINVYTIDNSVTQDSLSLEANMAGVSYQWLNCNDNFSYINEETEQLFTPSENGNYSVEITDGICKDTSECFIINVVNIEHKDFGNIIKVYPNPTQGYVEIDLGDVYYNVNMKIKSITGEVLLMKSFKQSEQISLDIIGSAGVYFIEIITKEGVVAVFKVIKTEKF